MGGLLIKTIRGLAEVNGTAPEFNSYVLTVVWLGVLVIAGLAALYGVVRLAKWAWTHPA